MSILIVPYKHEWPDEFRKIATPLRQTLGQLAERIDHIGSTSVQGLAAKDIIDIQVSVARIDATLLTAVLAPLGYTHLKQITHDHIPPGRNDPPEEWSKLFFRAPEQLRKHNLHIRQTQRANQRYALLFRDYLRTDPGTTGAYQQIKEALARLHPDDQEAYYDVKDPVCDIIMAAAEQWARATNYQPGPSDQ